jgi:hypothetical protein
MDNGGHPRRPQAAHRNREAPVNDEQTIERIVQAIETYLDEHPAATDTADGIARWWLPDGLQEPLLLGQALEVLVRRGRLLSVRLPDGRVRYRGALPARS